jgi:hypothetical protein
MSDTQEQGDSCTMIGHNVSRLLLVVQVDPKRQKLLGLKTKDGKLATDEVAIAGKLLGSTGRDRACQIFYFSSIRLSRLAGASAPAPVPDAAAAKGVAVTAKL